MEKECLILYSNGLDSRLSLKIMKEKGYSVTGIYFKLPFSKDFTKESKKFFKENKSELIIFDCTKEKNLKKYLNIIKKHKFDYGAGLNPCFDCKIFMFKIAKKIAKERKIKIIVSGEVIGQRPMSQNEHGLKLIENNSNLKNKIFRPLSAKMLPKVKGMNKEDYYKISGRRRVDQIELAKKFKMNYPGPGGGCLLCERELRKRFKFLIKEKLLTEKTLPLLKIGKHLNIEKKWFVVSKNEEESMIIEKFKNSIPSDKKTPAVYFHKKNYKTLAQEIQKEYKEKNTKRYEEFKL